MQHLTSENNQLNCRLTDFLKDLEDAMDNPSRVTLLMSRLRSANQKVTIENKRLRQAGDARFAEKGCAGECLFDNVVNGVL